MNDFSFVNQKNLEPTSNTNNFALSKNGTEKNILKQIYFLIFIENSWKKQHRFLKVDRLEIFVKLTEIFD